MAFEELKDEDLIEKIQNLSADPDEASGAAERYFKELYRRYYQKAYNFCRYYKLRHNDAVETIQDAFLKVFNYSASFQQGKVFRPWFFRILFNKINDKFNEIKKTRYDDIDDQAETLGEENEEIKLFHNREVLKGMIYRLPKHLRDCLLLYIYQEMDFKLVGQTIGISPRHARNRVDEALLELQRLAEENHA
jgi:RNA polymerase sigma factor (sigma-70 family)